MRLSTAIQDPLPELPERDREQFAARDETVGPDDSDSQPTGDREQHDSGRPDGMLRNPLLPLLGIAMVAFLDPLTDLALGANLGVSLLMVFPIYWAARTAGAMAGVLVAGTAGLLWVSSGVFVASILHARPAPYAMAGIHVALFAAAVVLALEHRRLLAERTLATTDFLTGVANRRGFFATLTREIERSRRYRTPMTLLYLDCDEFKSVKDTMGHPAGSRLLARIAAVLKANTRAVDVVGRLGGDEFAVVLAETSAERGAEVVARLQREMRSVLGPEPPGVTLSIEAVTFDSPPSGPIEAIRVADSLMYEAKRAGRNRAVHASFG